LSTTFNDFLEVLKDNHFQETPVDAKTFVEGEAYLGQPGLSDIQYDIVEAMSQIYRKEDLIDIMGEEKGDYPATWQGIWKRLCINSSMCIYCI
jgi:hypothetical protein